MEAQRKRGRGPDDDPQCNRVPSGRKLRLSLKGKAAPLTLAPLAAPERELQPFWVHTAAAASPPGQGIAVAEPTCSLGTWGPAQRSVSLAPASHGPGCCSETTEDTQDTACSGSSSSSAATAAGACACEPVHPQQQGQDHHHQQQQHQQEETYLTAGPIAAPCGAEAAAPAPAQRSGPQHDSSLQATSPPPRPTTCADLAVGTAAAAAAAVAAAPAPMLYEAGPSPAFSFGERACVVPDGITLLSWDIIAGLEAQAASEAE